MVNRKLLQNTTKSVSVYTVHTAKVIQGRPGSNSSSLELELELSVSSTTVVILVSATAHDIVGSSAWCTFFGADSRSIVLQALLVVVFEPFGL